VALCQHICLASVPRQWKVIQTVREKFVCRACETITQPPAPFHPIARGRAGPNLLAMILDAKFANHQPLNRQSEMYAREGIDLDVLHAGGLGGRLHRDAEPARGADQGSCAGG
jgi:transposase